MPKDAVTPDRLPIMEDFYTLQGEGAFQGHAAYFIRLGGCDVGCVWCDVKESWDAAAHPLTDVAEVALRAKESGAKFAVITGGEPVMYDLSELTSQILGHGMRTHLETSGAYPITGAWDWVCLSPKKFKAPHESSFSMADELKIVIYNKSDFEWAESFADKVEKNCQLFLQPEWTREKEMLPLIVNYIKENQKWRISLQIHKYLNIP